MIVFTDSTAGRSIATRFGAGKKTKHVELRYLYMQDLVRSGVLSIRKVNTKLNPTDIVTKYSPTEVLRNLNSKLGIVEKSHSSDFKQTIKTKQKLFHIACMFRLRNRLRQRLRPLDYEKKEERKK